MYTAKTENMKLTFKNKYFSLMQHAYFARAHLQRIFLRRITEIAEWVQLYFVPDCDLTIDF